jgi:hypothetical protein
LSKKWFLFCDIKVPTKKKKKKKKKIFVI